MTIASTNMPSGYSGIGTGTPRIITMETTGRTKMIIPLSIQMVVVESVEMLVTVKVPTVETAVSPWTCVDDVVVVVIAGRVCVTVVTKMHACMGLMELTVGDMDETNPCSATAITTYLLQANSATPTLSLFPADIRLPNRQDSCPTW